MMRRRAVDGPRGGTQRQTPGTSTPAGIAGERPNVAGNGPTRHIAPWGREPTPREIRERAYFLYLARGGVNGDPCADWLQAERELREELGSAAGGRGRRF